METLVQRQSVESDEEQLVVFRLGDESYGVSIEVVNTIIRLSEITAVPHTPASVSGVINLRGVIVPVIDLRRRFGLPASEATKASRIVVVENDGIMVGMIVDAVTETLRLSGGQIEPLSPLVQSVDAQYLRGVGKVGERLIILLALEQVLAREEVEQLQGMGVAEPVAV
jgi:purine-binding chemotaxis protein CheW